MTTYYAGAHFEWTGSTSTMIKYYYAGGQRVAMRVGSNAPSYLLGDHLGSTSITASSTGSKVAELRYHPWGGTRYTSGTTPTARRYTGQIEDAAIGLYFYNARYYDSALGRFIQADTIVPSPANPQSLNRYAYVLNNPLRYTDPTGHFTDEELETLLGDKWQELMQLWEREDPYWYHILRDVLTGGYSMTASEMIFPWRTDATIRYWITFAGSGKDIRASASEMNEKTGKMLPPDWARVNELITWQGKGAYIIHDPSGEDIGSAAIFRHFTNYAVGTPYVVQPQFYYGNGAPEPRGYNRIFPGIGKFQYAGFVTEMVKSLEVQANCANGWEFFADLVLLGASPAVGAFKLGIDGLTSLAVMAQDTTAYVTRKAP